MAGLRRALSALLPLATTVISTAAMAQDNATITEYVPEDQIKKVENEKRQGWDGTLQASANVNLVSNDNVVGQTDGLSTIVGLGFVGGLDYIYRKHEIRNTLKLTEAFARTPVLPQFVKSDDVLDIESLYNYFLLSWFGVFGRVNFDTAIFKSEQITATPTNYSISDGRGGPVELRTTERLPLADSLQPLTLSESLGIFAEPVQSTPFNLSARLGLGLRETWAQGVYVIKDDNTTDALIEVVDITNPDSGLTIFQGGVEGFLGVAGALREKRITYDLGATVLIPFINNDPQDRSASELTRIGVAGAINLAIVEWASLSYKLRVIRDPQLLDGVQVQNNLLLTFNYTFIERTEPEAPPEPSADEKAAEEAAKRAEEAEKRAAEAEARAAELEKQLAAPAVEATPTPTPEPTPEPEPEPAPQP